MIVLDLSLLFDDVLVCLPFCWCPCMAINVSVQYDGGFLPDIILLTQCYYHRGTRLNAMKRFCIYFQLLLIPPKRFDIFPPRLGCPEGLGAFRFFFKHTSNHFNHNDPGSRRSRRQRLDVWTIVYCIRYALGCGGRVCGLYGVVCIAGALMYLPTRFFSHAAGFEGILMV